MTLCPIASYREVRVWPISDEVFRVDQCLGVGLKAEVDDHILWGFDPSHTGPRSCISPPSMPA